MMDINRFDRRVTIPVELYTIFNQMHNGEKNQVHTAVVKALEEFVNGRIQIFDKALIAVEQLDNPKPKKKRSVPSSWLE
jgi:hypothetical protein